MALSPAESGAVAGQLEPLHSMIYFAPEAEAGYQALGLRPGRTGYFASRSAPLGPVGAGLVAALFYNFHPDLVARHLPAVWAAATPAAVLGARTAAADAALRRLLGPDRIASADVVEAAGLARTAAEACSVLGRPMAAALLDLPWPQAPHLVLWHAVTILREHRGDGHVAVLAVSGLSGLEALVTFTATGTGFLPTVARTARGWSSTEWADTETALRERGLLAAGLALTPAGDALRARVEADTDRLGHGPWAALGAGGMHRLGELGARLTGAVVAAGAFPRDVFAPGSSRNPQ